MKGIYVLTIWLPRSVKKKIGGLGEIHLDKGLYAYVGSAQNNLHKRVDRHLSKSKKMHWHIDYFLDLDYVSVPGVFVKEAGREEECLTAEKLGGEAVKGFGCSDCKCSSHLFRIDSPKKLLELGFQPI